MVVAGPGTGKTQVIGARISNILLQTDTAAEQILCLTFTEAATIALRNRLIDFIGTHAYRVGIYTYHAFCNKVIQENKDLFGIHDLNPISDLEKVEVIREIIDELEAGHVLKRYSGDVYYEYKGLRNLFDLMKKDNLSPEGITSEVEQLMKAEENSEEHRYKRATKTAQAGDLKPSYFTLKKQMEKLIAAAKLFTKYDNKLRALKRYDYSDMILWVIELFRNREELLLQYQEQFQYVLVDEYQDTNGAQNDLLYLLVNYWDNPNLFVVGDDDQSIYKFQGANVKNIVDLYAAYQADIKLISLTQNYRSTQNILDAASTVIANNQERLVSKVDFLNKDIIASNPDFADLQIPVQVYCYPNPYQEIIGLANQINELKEQNVPLREIAILYRNHSQSEDLMKYLKARDVSYAVSKTMDVFEVPMIKQLLTTLNYIALETAQLDAGKHLLFEMLHFNHFESLTPYEVSQLSIELRSKKQWRPEFNEMTIDRFQFLKPESFSELKQFTSDLEYWLKELHNITLQHLVEQIMSKGGFIPRALSGDDAIFEVQCLSTFFNFVKDETSKDP